MLKTPTSFSELPPDLQEDTRLFLVRHRLDDKGKELLQILVRMAFHSGAVYALEQTERKNAAA